MSKNMDIELLKTNLEKKEYTVSVFEDKKSALEYLNKKIDGVTVGMGGSMTAKEMGLYEALKSHNTVYSHGNVSAEERAEIMKSAQTADIYISSVNGVAETGELVNIDGTCNRVSATLFGHKKVYFIVGTNKVEENLDKAIWRARNIASPLNCKRFGIDTPCVKLGYCTDCSHPKRICKAMTVFFKKPSCSEYEVVIIKDSLGY